MSNLDKLKEESQQKITDICFKNGGVTKPMVDKLEELYAAAIDQAYAEGEKAGRIDELNSLITRTPGSSFEFREFGYILNMKARKGVLDRLASLKGEGES